MKTLRQLLDNWSNDYTELEKKYKKITGAQLVTDPYSSFCKGPDQITKSATVLIGTYNSKQSLEKSLISIDESSFHKKYPHLLEVVVVDDGSTDGTREMVENSDVGYRLKYILQGRGGLTMAHNTGLAFVENDIIIFSDSDMVHTQYALEELMKRHEILDSIVLAGFRFEIDSEDPRISIANLRTSLNKLVPEFYSDFRLNYPGKPENICRETNHWKNFSHNKLMIMSNGAGYNLPGMVIGAFFSIRRDDYIKMDGSDERLTGWGCEDSLIGARAIGLGNYIIPVYSSASAHISHPRLEPTDVNDFMKNIQTTERIVDEEFIVSAQNNVSNYRNRVKDHFVKTPSRSAPVKKKNLRSHLLFNGTGEEDAKRGKYYFSLGFFDKALACYIKAIRRSSHTFWLHFDKGKTLRELHNYEEAIEAFSECLIMDSKNPSVYIELGHTYAAMADYRNAQQAFDNGRNVDPNNYEIKCVLDNSSEQHKSRGNHYANQGDHELAIRDFDLALTIDQNNCWAHFDRGKSLRERGKFKEALQSFVRADKILHQEDNNRTWLHTEIGETYVALKQHNRAKLELETALQLFPENSQALNCLEKLKFKREEENNLICHFPLIQKIKEIDGWFSEGEADLMIAATIKAAGIESSLSDCVSIVEIGSYCGKSTTAIGLALKALGEKNLKLYAIDPHTGYELAQVPDTYEVLKEDLNHNNLEEYVQIIKAKSTEVKWHKPIALLFIDGLHDYESVKSDFEHFHKFVVPEGLIAFHDYASYYPEVKKFVNEILQNSGFQFVTQRDSLILIKKSKNAVSIQPLRHQGTEDF